MKGWASISALLTLPFFCVVALEEGGAREHIPFPAPDLISTRCAQCSAPFLFSSASLWSEGESSLGLVETLTDSRTSTWAALGMCVEKLPMFLFCL